MRNEMLKRMIGLLFAAFLITGCTEIEESVLEENRAVAEEEVVEQVEEDKETSTNENEVEDSNEEEIEESEPEVAEEVDTLF